jgi:lysine-specific demethylase 3
MYNAFESSEDPGGNGTTRLHMDMADAVNIMLYAAPRQDGSPGCAAWDIFRAEDAGKIREFLHLKFPNEITDDPIHTQCFFLDTNLRKELQEEYGVISWRIYQKPGEAVFIPAGCAHQVCNLADCIKVAVDFVSTENIERCQLLTQEFREQNQNVAWKEDVLQLQATMWYAWLSCCRAEREICTREGPA